MMVITYFIRLLNIFGIGLILKVRDLNVFPELIKNVPDVFISISKNKQAARLNENGAEITFLP